MKQQLSNDKSEIIVIFVALNHFEEFLRTFSVKKDPNVEVQTMTQMPSKTAASFRNNE